MSHALARTSPKGPGQQFVGRCIKCGLEGLDTGAALEDCPQDHIVSDEAAVLRCIASPEQDVGLLEDEAHQRGEAAALEIAIIQQQGGFTPEEEGPF